MNKIYLLIGGNIGDRLYNLELAKNLLEEQLGEIINCSAIYETAAWGKTDQPDFLNQVLLVETKFKAQECMNEILFIENKMGRIRTNKNDPRIIDIDILFFNDDVIHESHLTVPHPEIQNRQFVLMPLNEIAPDFIHPVFNQPIKNLLSTCKDELQVKQFNKA